MVKKRTCFPSLGLSFAFCAVARGRGGRKATLRRNGGTVRLPSSLSILAMRLFFTLASTEASGMRMGFVGDVMGGIGFVVVKVGIGFVVVVMVEIGFVRVVMVEIGFVVVVIAAIVSGATPQGCVTSMEERSMRLSLTMWLSECEKSPRFIRVLLGSSSWTW